MIMTGGNIVDERLQRTADAAKAAGADWAVLTDVGSVAYAVGHVVPVEAGPSPFAGGPSTAFVGADGRSGLVVANVEGAAAKACRADEIVLYEGFAFDHAADPAANYAAAIAKIKKTLGVGGTLAIEEASFPVALSRLLEGRKIADLGTWLDRQRATKTAAEKAALRRAAQAAAIGQEACRTAARPGRTELDVFADIRAAMENFASERVPVTGDFLSGRARTAAFTGWPVDRMVEAGDPIISDLAPRVAGYWGDSCASSVVGTPTAAYLKLFEAAKSALDLALEMMRPGLIIADLDAALRAQVGRSGYAYPHHSGHSLGTTVHEWPRLVPYETAALEKGMFVMVEPGAYDADVGGVRLEWMIEITADGCLPVAPFEHLPGIEIS
jgi:Xaa-Pro aminopeptidase